MAIVADMAVFCISLPNSPRRAAFAASAAPHGLAFEFIDAISPAGLRDGAAVEGCRIDITDLRWTHHERADPRRQQAPLTFAEIGCAYSHIRCWQLARERGLDHVCVFEDDAVIFRTPQGIDIPDATDMIYLSDRMPHNRYGDIIGDGNGTEGYILSRAGVRKCLEIFTVLYMPVDLQIMAHQWCNIRRKSGISGYRRQLDSACYLHARVATPSCCHHPDYNESQMYPSDSQRLAAERDWLRLELNALRRSTSWRLTAPARALKAALGRTTRAAIAELSDHS